MNTPEAPNADLLPVGSQVYLKGEPRIVDCGELNTHDLADGTHLWDIAAVEEHDGVLCYRLTCKRLGGWVSYNTMMNGCPSEHDSVTREHWVPVANTEESE